MIRKFQLDYLLYSIVFEGNLLRENILDYSNSITIAYLFFKYFCNFWVLDMRLFVFLYRVCVGVFLQQLLYHSITCVSFTLYII